MDVWFTPDRHARGRVRFADRHTGAPGFAHGGAVAAALDDLLGQVLVVLDQPAVTASLTVDFRAPTLLDCDIVLDAWCERVDGRKLHLRAVARDGERVVAEARALFLAVELSHWRREDAPSSDAWMRQGLA